MTIEVLQDITPTIPSDDPVCFEVVVKNLISDIDVGNTETLPAGSDAYVRKTLDNNTAVLDFGIPRGADGADGQDGKDGVDGKDGTDGVDGQDATINGVSTLTLTADNGLALQQTGSTANISGKALSDEIDDIQELIPAQASDTNQLADKNFVNSTVQTGTANFRGNWADWATVPTNANDYPVDYAGNKTPTVNDYLVVQDASDYTGETLDGTWRFKYSGEWSVDGKSGWLPEYPVNETPMTAAQLAALNSGATTTNIGQIGTNTAAIGTLASLTTTTKTDLVSAVNEVNATASSKVSDVQFNGTSVTIGGVANIQIATQAQVQAKSATGNPLTPSNIDDIGGSVSRSVYDNVQAITAGAINLVDGSVFYTTSPSANTAYTISTSALTQTGFSYRYFNVILTQPSVPVACDFTTNNNVKWAENTEPDLSTGGRTYLLAFQTFDGGSNWVGSLCTWWE